MRALAAQAGVGLAALALASLLTGAVSAQVSTERVAAGLALPVYATSPPGDPSRLFVLELGESGSARILILDLDTDELLAEPFLSLSGIQTGGEQGLFAMAFHPEFAENRRFYLSYTVPGQPSEAAISVVAEGLARDDDPDLAEPGPLRRILNISQPQSNHNGGWLGFGPDGYLYLGIGDGGGGNDDDDGHTAGTGNGQDTTDNLLGKILRLDVDGDDFPRDPDRNYSIPLDNPFVGIEGDDEIWAYGLRNPWRASFDRVTGDLYIGDVGQNAREELDLQPAASSGGENYGWRLREGTIATPGVGGPPPLGAVDPIHDYEHSVDGGSVTGGYVYRGPVAELWGHYFFADYVRREIWSFRFDGTNIVDLQDRTAELTPDVGRLDDLASFGEDALGNLYILDLDGEIFRVVPEPGRSLAAALGIGLAGALGRSVQARRRRCTELAAQSPLPALSETETPAR